MDARRLQQQHELSRLQEKETLLNHLLVLERERRIRAERQVEAEKQACLELRHLLVRERKARRERPLSPSQTTLGMGSFFQGGASDGAPATALLQQRRGSTSVDPIPLDYPTAATGESVQEGIGRNFLLPPVPGAGGIPRELSTSTSASGELLPAFSFSEDFASAIFDQLPTDLQESLRLGSKFTVFTVQV